MRLRSKELARASHDPCCGRTPDFPAPAVHRYLLLRGASTLGFAWNWQGESIDAGRHREVAR
ncbi:hypothetical protein ACVJGD_003345 [Bradyrhizobium sp. USDA 10063]